LLKKPLIDINLLFGLCVTWTLKVLTLQRSRHFMHPWGRLTLKRQRSHIFFSVQYTAGTLLELIQLTVQGLNIDFEFLELSANFLIYHLFEHLQILVVLFLDFGYGHFFGTSRGPFFYAPILILQSRNLFFKIMVRVHSFL
jgi:hypothetical protein